MKFIIKQEPENFKLNFKKNKITKWKDFSIKFNTEFKKYILEKEQNCQCAYTERYISFDNTNSHIDHFRKQEHFPNLTFDWNNLFVATNNEYYGAKYKDKKIKKEEYSLIINPTLDNPNKHLEYSMNGNINGKDAKGIKTIEIFNLNHRSLVEERKETIKIILDLKKNNNFENSKSIFNKFTSLINQF